MNRPVFLAALVFGFASLTSCQSLPGSAGAGSANSQAQIAKISGDWIYSQMGTPTIQNSLVSQGMDFMAQSATGARISIQPSGKTSLLFGGHTGEFQIRVKEDTDLYLKLGATKNFGKNNWFYDKKNDLLVMNAQLELPDSKGTVPIYFKRN